MATWKSRGLRGSTLEDLINRANEKYLENHLCLIQKVPTPITPIEFDKGSRTIKLAYFDKKSTVDYIGVVQGIPVCFDAKECAVDTFTLANIHEHQVRFMEDFEKQGGISFLIILFTTRNDLYYMPFKELKAYLNRVEQGHPKNFKYNELSDDFFLKKNGPALVPYLEGLNLDLNLRDKDL